MHLGKCPSCNKIVQHILVDNIEIQGGNDAIYNGITYQCPFCRAILGVEIDPFALKADIVQDVKKAFGKD